MNKAAAKYARQEIEAGRFVNMPITEICGAFYLCDSDWNILAGAKSYATRIAAETERSKIIGKACKYIA